MSYITKLLMGGGLGKRFSLVALAALFGTSLSAQLAPPGVLRSVTVTDAAPAALTLPFVPSETDPADAFAGQLESAITLHLWDAPTQTWKTATYDPNTGWSGDTITLSPAAALQLSSTPHSALRIPHFFLGGLLPAAPISIDLHPGLNALSSPLLSSLPFADAWRLRPGNADARPATSLPSLPKGRLDGTDGDVTPEALTWFRLKGEQPLTTVGQSDDRWSARALPAVSHVAYDAKQNVALVTVTTAGTDGQTLDLFYQDIPRDGSEAKWKVWQLTVQPGPGSNFVFTLPHSSFDTRHSSFRLYQVADGLADTDNDGYSDAHEALVLGTDPAHFDAPPAPPSPPAPQDSDLDGVSDEDERRAGTDTLRPDNPAVKFNVFTPLR